MQCLLAQDLFGALRDNNVSLLEHLLLAGAPADTCDSNGHTLLHWAALEHNISAMQLLVDHGADVNAKGKEISLSVFLLEGICTMHTFKKAFDQIFCVYPSTKQSGYGIFLNSQTQHAILLHSKNRTPSLIALPTTNEGRSPFQQLLQDICSSKVLAQVECFSGLTPLHWAILSQNTDAVRFLLAHGARGKELCTVAGNKKATMLNWAERLSTPEIIDLIEQYKKDRKFFISNTHRTQTPQSNGVHKTTQSRQLDTLVNPLFKAVEDHDTHALLVALNNGFDPNTRDTLGQTALHHAVQAGQLDCATLLLSRKAYPSCKDKQGNTPLHTVINSSCFIEHENFPAITGLLLNMGADVDAQNKEGLTPLSYGVINPYELALAPPTLPHDQEHSFLDQLLFCPPELALLLLQHGADINRNNCPLLATAYKLNLTQAINLLLNYGAFTDDIPITEPIGIVTHSPRNLNHLKEYINKLLYYGHIAHVLNLINQLNPIARIAPNNLTIPIYIQLTLNLSAAEQPYRALEMALEYQLDKVTKAIKADDIDQVKNILGTGLPVALCDAMANNLLHVAAQAGSTNSFKYILNIKPRLIGHANKAGNRPLDLMDKNLKRLLYLES